MTDIQLLLKKFSRRVRFMRAWRGAAVGGSIGAFASCLWAMLDFLRISYTNWSLMAIPVVAGIVFGAIVGFVLKVSDQALADSIDRRADLENRLGTAIEDKTDGDLRGVQRVDAISHLKGLKPAKVYPVKMSRWHSGLVAICVVASALFLLGNSPLLLNDQQKQDQADLKKAAEAIERVAKPVLDEKPEAMTPEEKEFSNKMKRFANELEKGRIPKQEAMEKANELSKQADELTRTKFAETEKQLNVAKDAFNKMMQDAMKDQGMNVSDEQLQNADPMSNMDPQAMAAKDQELKNQEEQLNKQMSDIQKQLDSGKNKDGKPLSEKEKQELLKQQEALRKAMKGIQMSKQLQEFLKKLASLPEYKQLQEMMRKMQQGAQSGKQGQSSLTEEQIKEMMKKLEELAKQLKDTESMKKFLKAMMEALKKGGKACQCAGICPGIGLGLGMGAPAAGQDPQFQVSDAATSGMDSDPKNQSHMDTYGSGQPNTSGAPTNDHYVGNTHVLSMTKNGRTTKAKEDVMHVTGDRQENGKETYVEIKGPSGVGSKSRTPYFNVLPKYKKQAEQALDKQQIPKNQQKRVKEYFESLQKGGG